jgi:hypothetical protein
VEQASEACWGGCEEDQLGGQFGGGGLEAGGAEPACLLPHLHLLVQPTCTCSGGC